MIEIQVNSQSVMDALNRLIQRGQNLHPVLDAIGQRMEERVSNRFETETDPSGHPWAPWKPSTIKSYPKDGNRSLLDRYGDMLNSLSHQADATSVRIGFGQPYAFYHELGTSKMPRRGMLTADPVARTLGQEDERDILELITGYFEK